VLISLDAAGVGVWDAWIREGSWRPTGRAKFPLIPGTDGAGVVVAKGPLVRRFHIGERVYASGYGFYAEYAAADTEDVGHVPKPLDPLHAGAVVTTGLRALQGIDDAIDKLRKLAPGGIDA
jgi:NADPH2:quinone reductase